MTAFDRCRGRAYATQLRAAHAARAIGGHWFECRRCGHWHARRDLTGLLRKAVAA